MAKTIITKKYGNTEVSVEFEKVKSDLDALQIAAHFSEEDVCKKCWNKDIKLCGKKSDDYTFIWRKCKNRDCGYESKLGQYKAGGYFWKEWEEGWKPDTPGTATTFEEAKEILTGKPQSQSSQNAPAQKDIDEASGQLNSKMGNLEYPY